jgi:hypothetical protein
VTLEEMVREVTGRREDTKVTMERHRQGLTNEKGNRTIRMGRRT